MPDIIPGDFGIHGGLPSARWRGEGPVRDFEPREVSDVLVTRDMSSNTWLCYVLVYA